MAIDKKIRQTLKVDSNSFDDHSVSIMNHFTTLYPNLPHPYVKMVLDHGQRIKIKKLDTNKRLEILIDYYFRTIGYERNGCFFNSYGIMRNFNKEGIRYVEGLVRDNGFLCTHAWISFEGSYFDPTWEMNRILLQRERGIESDFDSDQEYLKIIEFSMRDFKTFLNKSGAPWKGRPPIDPPFAAKVFSIPHKYGDDYNFTHESSSTLFVRLLNQFRLMK